MGRLLITGRGTEFPQVKQERRKDEEGKMEVTIRHNKRFERGNLKEREKTQDKSATQEGEDSRVVKWKSAPSHLVAASTRRPGGGGARHPVPQEDTSLFSTRFQRTQKGNKRPKGEKKDKGKK